MAPSQLRRVPRDNSERFPLSPLDGPTGCNPASHRAHWGICCSALCVAGESARPALVDPCGQPISRICRRDGCVLISSPLIAAAVAAGVATGVMAVLRCTHPPSGAVALTAVLGGPTVHATGYHFLLVPVLLNSVLLTVVAVAYNNLTGVSYPHKAHAPAHPHPPTSPLTITEADFDTVLADYGEALDIGREDLQRIYEELVGRAEERRKETVS